jgi:Flp pilus assembly protein TadG
VRERSRRTKRAREQGSAAVEFALVLPLVLILALALVQVGILVKDGLIVEEAARAGARQAAVTTDDASARQAAVDAATSLDPDRLNVIINRSGGSGSPVTVGVVYHAPVSVPLVNWLFRSAIDLSGKATMRQETG